jgi:sigma-E factor negative regulatory protein RseC
MIEEMAIVVKIGPHQVWVESAQANGCAACVQKTSCTTNAIGSVLKKRAVVVDTPLALKLGDTVLVAIDENVLLRASLVLYLLPLLALFSGAGLADYCVGGILAQAELWVAATAVLGFLSSLWLINKLQNSWFFGHYARPVIVKKL